MPAPNQCLFCYPAAAVLENALVFALPDRFPVTPGHMLPIPRRHTSPIGSTPRRTSARRMPRLPAGAAQSGLAPAVILTPDARAQFSERQRWHAMLVQPEASSQPPFLSRLPHARRGGLAGRRLG